MNNCQIYQIFYDEPSKALLDPNFIPLDNSRNSRPDWYEFWPILNWLSNNRLNDECWYGFLSPKFTQKSKFTSREVKETLRLYGHTSEVALFSDSWDQLAYFLNPFEQGEVWHPGLLNLTQSFLNSINFEIQLKKLVTNSTTSVFSNFIIAKPKYWHKWIELSKKFYDYVESSNNKNLIGSTQYGSQANRAPMRAFIQERFPSIILSTGKFKVLTPDQSLDKPISSIFENSSKTRRILQTLDLLKSMHSQTKEVKYLEMYYLLRSEVRIKLN